MKVSGFWKKAARKSLGMIVLGTAVASGTAVTLLPQGECVAQEAAAASDDPLTKFRDAFAAWNNHDKQMEELSVKYTKSTKLDEQKALREEYTKLLGESESKFTTLQKAAEAAFDAAPNQDSEVTKVVMGVVSYLYRQDDYEAAAALGKKLLDGGVKEPALLSLLGRNAYAMDDYAQAETLFTAAKEAGKLEPRARDEFERLGSRKKLWAEEVAKRERDAKKDDLPRVKIETSKGTVVVELFEEEAPETVGNFISLIEAGKYNGTVFHRVLPGFMAQGGDPKGDGTGGPGYTIFCECEKPEHRNHFRGTLSMAHAGKDTGGSQFFLTFQPTHHLDGRHTAFGRVIEGFPVLAKLQRRDPQSANPPAPDKIVKMEVIRKRDHEYKPNKSGDKD